MVSEELARSLSTAAMLKAVFNNLEARVGLEIAAADKALEALDGMIGDLEERNVAQMAEELGLEPAIKGFRTR